MNVATQRPPAAWALLLLAALPLGFLAAKAGATTLLQPTPQPCPRCPAPPSAMDAMQASAATFVGTVTSVVVNEAAEQRREVSFDVSETWTSNTVSASTTVDVPRDAWECGRQLAVGERWIVYAQRADGDRLAIDVCDRSHRMQADDPDRNELGQGCRPYRGLGIYLSPLPARVGDAVELSLRPDGFLVMDFQVQADPAEAIALDASCSPRCQGNSTAFRALVAGTVQIAVGAFGEYEACWHGNRGWSWGYPNGSASLEILPPDAAPSATPTPPAGVTPDPPHGLRPAYVPWAGRR